MTVTALSPIWNGQQFFDSQGRVLNGGKIYQYASGTTTPQGTWTTQVGNVANANPIVLDSSGRYANQIWFTSGQTYKLVLTDSANNVLNSQDNLVGLNDQPLLGNGEWLAVGSVPTYVSASYFTNAVDTSATYTVGRRVRAHVTGGAIVYGTVTQSFYSIGITHVYLLMDGSSVLDAGLTAVDVGVLSSIPRSTPLVVFSARKTADQTLGTQVIYEILEFQVGTGYDYTSGVFTAPFDGWYSFSAAVQLNNISAGTIANGLFLVVNSGGTQTASGQSTIIANGQTLDYTTTVNAIRLNANDTCHAEVGSCGVGLPIKGGWFSRFSGFML